MNINFKLKRRSFSFLNTKADYFFSTGVFGQFYQFDSKVLKKIYSIINNNGKAVFTVKINDDITWNIRANDRMLDQPTLAPVLLDQGWGPNRGTHSEDQAVYGIKKVSSTYPGAYAFTHPTTGEVF